MELPTHVPVMLAECLEYLAIKPDGIYLECTAGLGGHSRAIAERLSTLSGGLLIACDRDAESLELARANTAAVADRIHFYQASFTELERTLKTEEVSQLDKLRGSPLQVDGLLADLGVSRYQLTNAERGFSLMSDGELDMRMNRSQQQTAADLVNFEAEKELADLIYKLGEERRSRKIARAIVRARPITSTGHLAKVIEQAVPRTGKLHPATQTFMALRIATNQELEELDALLESIPRLVKPGGRVVVLTFMSLEDRAVKHGFQEMARSSRATILTRHVVRPAEEEIRSNPPSRSAKLRAVELL
jgi:16S rRNA (cytosine1402-N4)-methyltransferase